MQNNRPLTIYTARSRKDIVLQAAPMDVQELFTRLSQSQTIPVDHADFMKLSKAQQTEQKDIGAYIAGELNGGRRRNGCITSRSCLVVDIEGPNVPGAEEVARVLNSLGCCYALHSTAKHGPTGTHLRAVIPLAGDIPAEQYSPVLRLTGQLICPGLDWFDPSTDEPGRLMFWPSHCQDVAPVWYAEDKPLLDAAALLARLPDWRDVSSWPHFPKEGDQLERDLKKARQQDPTTKEGVIGAFCRIYDVPAAMNKFLPGVYEETTTAGRYTFTNGSTWGGAVVYDNGKFLYSNHATDPAGGRLVNAWDLVRLHLFGALDDEAKEGAKGNRLPSYTAMYEMARSDEAVSDLLARKAAESAFKGFVNTADDETAMALGRYAGEPLSLNVLRLALTAMGIHAKLNLITGRAEIIGLPPQYSAENAGNILPVLLVDRLRALGVKGVNKTTLEDYLAIIFDENRYNPVLEMLNGVVWDGVNRLPELLRILGVDPAGLEASLVRKWLIQCVAMANNSTGRREAAEGVLTLQGSQGIGKTLFFRRLSLNSEWFAEGVTLDLKNKDHIMVATGAWITELGELDSTLRRDQSSLKAFITSPVDRVRAPYAREATFSPRRTSFCATVNPGTFLRDETGDRRFWVVDVDHIALSTLLALPDEWFVQLWGEAVTWWRAEPQDFRLTPEERRALDNSNNKYREALPGEEEIRQGLNFDLPANRWGEFSASQLQTVLYTLRNSNLSTQQIGRALAKLVREDKRITSRLLRGVRLYRLPILQTIEALPAVEKKPTTG